MKLLQKKYLYLLIISGIASTHVSAQSPDISTPLTVTQVTAETMPNVSILQHGSALVNYGIFNLVNTVKQPTLLLIGTEAVALLALSCLQNDPFACIQSFIAPENISLVSQLVLENIATGGAYAIGEELETKALALTQTGSLKQLTQTLIASLAAGGLGFYAWSLDESIDKALLLSLSSAIIMTALNNISQQPSIQVLRAKIMNSLATSPFNIGKIIGVATVAGGTCALTYNALYSQELVNSIVSATKNFYSSGSLSAIQDKLRSNYSWITGYRWTKSIFKQLPFSQ